ncbi:MAG TPA: hypothetical protein VHD32_09825 [Candidatus Didemnitutus sp.]|nr:hypothetical protein [Candidatus Didemnitutus sp.]
MYHTFIFDMKIACRLFLSSCLSFVVAAGEQRLLAPGVPLPSPGLFRSYTEFGDGPDWGKIDIGYRVAESSVSDKSNTQLFAVMLFTNVSSSKLEDLVCTIEYQVYNGTKQIKAGKYSYKGSAGARILGQIEATELFSLSGPEQGMYLPLTGKLLLAERRLRGGSNSDITRFIDASVPARGFSDILHARID